MSNTGLQTDAFGDQLQSRIDRPLKTCINKPLAAKEEKTGANRSHKISKLSIAYLLLIKVCERYKLKNIIYNEPPVFKPGSLAVRGA